MVPEKLVSTYYAWVRQTTSLHARHCFCTLACLEMLSPQPRCRIWAIYRALFLLKSGGSKVNFLLSLLTCTGTEMPEVAELEFWIRANHQRQITETTSVPCSLPRYLTSLSFSSCDKDFFHHYHTDLKKKS